MKFQVMLKRGYSHKGYDGLRKTYGQDEIIECDEDLAERFNTDGRNGVKFRRVWRAKAKFPKPSDAPQSVVEAEVVQPGLFESE